MNQLTVQQQGWIRLADMKTLLFEELQKAELEIQGILAEINAETLKTAKNKMASAKEKRMSFTRLIDEKLLNPSMEYEKRMANVINAAAVVELEQRKKAEVEAFEAQAIINEEAEFKAHLINEYHRIGAENRLNYEKAINAWYRTGLEKCEIDLSDIFRVLAAIEEPQINKFSRNYISDERAIEIFATISKYDSIEDLEFAKGNAKLKYHNFSNDFANAEATIKALELEAKQRETEIANEIVLTTATNTLIAQAETIVIETPKIKRELKIVVVESEMWAISVTNNFIRLLPHLAKYLRVKSWSKLTIGQMADALAKYMTETGTIIGNLKTEEVCK
jgi:hypothetical protein